MGSFSSAQWSSLAVCALLILPALVAIQICAWRFNLLQLSEEDTHYMGDRCETYPASATGAERVTGRHVGFS
ncbi:iron chelate uptake ABC transporter family permease subunit [Pantoea agglomerans]|uniref:iron chelate uptake ABC transporter family permease subunit n=1 Tax=Pantoea TaxID=53335 RepID=UPI00092D3AE0|nr:MULTISPECIES: iron chelate uptake ABC transporter family permease subunit [Pantoea]